MACPAEQVNLEERHEYIKSVIVAAEKQLTQK